MVELMPITTVKAIRNYPTCRSLRKGQMLATMRAQKTYLDDMEEQQIYSAQVVRIGAESIGQIKEEVQQKGTEHDLAMRLTSHSPATE